MLRKSVPFIPPLPPSVTLSTMHTLFPFSVPPMRSRVYAHRCTRIRGLLTVLRAASMIYRGRRAPQASLETSLETVEEPSDRISRMIDRALLAGCTSPPSPPIRLFAVLPLLLPFAISMDSFVHGSL